MIALVAIPVLLVVTRPEQNPELREAVSPRVQVETVALHDLQPLATVSGRLEPARKTALHFELSGQVDARPASTKRLYFLFASSRKSSRSIHNSRVNGTSRTPISGLFG